MSWEEGGKRREKSTHTPTALVSELIAKHADSKGEVPGLAVRRPTLEDTYLALVGHHSEELS